MKKFFSLLILLVMAAMLTADCGGEKAPEPQKSAERVFTFGDTTFNAENEVPDVNPHNAYSGWACVRYGVGETLFRYNDRMEQEPWLAESFELEDELTWKIRLRDDVTFSNGRKLDAQAVKECLERLIRVHQRARGDLGLAAIEAEGQILTLKTKEPEPSLLNYLGDPYGCIIDVQAGVTPEGIVVGTGPYVVKKVVPSQRVELERNERYWGGKPGLEKIVVRTISNGDVLTAALQSGQIDAAYGMPYASYPLFQNDKYAFTSAATSRVFFGQVNFASPVMQDKAVRRAIALGVNKEAFVQILLKGYGEVATGCFPDSFAFGGKNLRTEGFAPEKARDELAAAGWIDTDGDGIREKNGQKLRVRWLTYPSRQEQPLLAEAAQSDLKKLGIDLVINNTADHNTVVRDPKAWDIYVSAFVTCGTGDPLNFFSTVCLDSSTKNRGGYHSDRVEELARELKGTFDRQRRGKLAVEIQQELLDDAAFCFFSFLKMSMISKAEIQGLKASASDYYEITKELSFK